MFVFYFFYRTTPCVSTVFAVVRCRSIHLSIRLSHSCIVSRRLKMSSNFFLGPVSPSFSFLIPCAGTQFQGEPIQRGVKYIGSGKICDFRLNHRLSRNGASLTHGLLRNVNKKSQAADQSVSVPMTLSDLERRDSRGQIFRRVSLIRLLPFYLERPNSAG